MNSDTQKLLREVLHQHTDSVGIFDRLATEYRTVDQAGRQELFLAVVAELAAAQAAARAMAGSVGRR